MSDNRTYDPPYGMEVRIRACSRKRVRETTRVHLRVCPRYTSEMPKGFSCDGCSIPWWVESIARYLDPGDIRERGSYWHDFNYRYQPDDKAIVDAEFYGDLKDDFRAAGCVGFIRGKFLPWFMWKMVTLCGYKAWKENREHLGVFRVAVAQKIQHDQTSDKGGYHV